MLSAGPLPSIVLSQKDSFGLTLRGCSAVVAKLLKFSWIDTTQRPNPCGDGQASTVGSTEFYVEYLVTSQAALPLSRTEDHFVCWLKATD